MTSTFGSRMEPIEKTRRQRISAALVTPVSSQVRDGSDHEPSRLQPNYPSKIFLIVPRILPRAFVTNLISVCYE